MALTPGIGTHSKGKPRDTHPLVGLFLTKDAGLRADQNIDMSLNKPTNAIKPSQIHNIGMLGWIIDVAHASSGSGAVYRLQVVPTYRRLKIKESWSDEISGHIFANVDEIVEDPEDSEEQHTFNRNQYIQAQKDITKLLTELAKHDNSQYLKILNTLVDKVDQAELSDLVAPILSNDPQGQQKIMESNFVYDKLNIVKDLLEKRIGHFQAQKESESPQGESQKKYQSQREIYLRNLMEKIKRELGVESDDSDKFVEEIEKKMKEKIKVPEQVKTTVTEELSKFQSLEKSSSEFQMTRNYLNWITDLPWGNQPHESFDIQKSKQILESQHFGLEEVKKRILEFIAVGQRKNSVAGKIICFVGPPGVGKTSIGKSIAQALGKEFFRISVGGMNDFSEIKGHRRTYIGAMPGKLIQNFKRLKTQNPVIMIDEIDKMGISRQGDPMSALLEVLDPQQNKGFLDHYLDVEFDLSGCLFICTANETEGISRPLLDRMEVIRLSGYIEDEKIEIAKRYLVPKLQASMGMSQKLKIKFSTLLFKRLVKEYAREAGVRELEKLIEKIMRKIALRVVKGKYKRLEETNKSLMIPSHKITTLIGHPRFRTDKFYKIMPSGVVMGLAWTAMGGATLYIETVSNFERFEARTQGDIIVESESGKSEEHGTSGGIVGLATTGQLGETMKESVEIAFTFAKNYLFQRVPNNKFFYNNSGMLHLHIPEGATPKDGPSAGCTIVTSILSLAMNKPVVENLAMTGEITLTGKIRAIGGVKEKMIAGKRSGVKKFIFPKDNEKDWEEIPQYIRGAVEVHFVTDYREIFDIAFPKNIIRKKSRETTLPPLTTTPPSTTSTPRSKKDKEPKEIKMNQ